MDNKLEVAFEDLKYTFKFAANFTLDVNGRTDDGVTLLELHFRSGEAAVPVFSVDWMYPFNDIQARFTGHYWADRYIIPNWYGGMNMAFNDGSPLYALYSSSGENRITVAVSDTLPRTHMVADIDEANSNMLFTVRLTPGSAAATTDYRVTLRLDRRTVPIYKALDELSSWWAGLEGSQPMPVPDDARKPYYSTWYAYHISIDAERLVHEAKLAKALGCSGVILDFGWQIPADQYVGAQFGQWELATDKFPDMAATVQAIHDMGMTMLVWFSVPHINRANPLFEEMTPYIIDPEEEPYCFLDPRFREVREFLVERYLRALREWNIDGFKLDFIDSYAKYLAERQSRPKLRINDAHDIADFDLALDTLLREVSARLTAAKPDILIEFRQNYTGPRMRAYGNIFRAMDCALGSHTNRFRTADIRMLAGSSAVHSDMFTWNGGESPEAAALQFINILHAVPQISVKIADLSPDHYRMLKYYTGFWNEHRDALQFGEFKPLSPENLYPAITCQTSDKQVSVLYNRVIVAADASVGTLVLVNGSHHPSVTADFSAAAEWDVTVNDCMGATIAKYAKETNGIATFDVPPSGVVTLVKKNVQSA